MSSYESSIQISENQIKRNETKRNNTLDMNRKNTFTKKFLLPKATMLYANTEDENSSCWDVYLAKFRVWFREVAGIPENISVTTLQFRSLVHETDYHAWRREQVILRSFYVILFLLFAVIYRYFQDWYVYGPDIVKNNLEVIFYCTIIVATLLCLYLLIFIVLKLYQLNFWTIKSDWVSYMYSRLFESSLGPTVYTILLVFVGVHFALTPVLRKKLLPDFHSKQYEVFSPLLVLYLLLSSAAFKLTFHQNFKLSLILMLSLVLDYAYLIFMTNFSTSVAISEFESYGSIIFSAIVGLYVSEISSRSMYWSLLVSLKKHSTMGVLGEVFSKVRRKAIRVDNRPITKLLNLDHLASYISVGTPKLFHGIEFREPAMPKFSHNVSIPNIENYFRRPRIPYSPGSIENLRSNENPEKVTDFLYHGNKSQSTTLPSLDLEFDARENNRKIKIFSPLINDLSSIVEDDTKHDFDLDEEVLLKCRNSKINSVTTGGLSISVTAPEIISKINSSSEKYVIKENEDDLQLLNVPSETPSTDSNLTFNSSMSTNIILGIPPSPIPVGSISPRFLREETKLARQFTFQNIPLTPNSVARFTDQPNQASESNNKSNMFRKIKAKLRHSVLQVARQRIFDKSLKSHKLKLLESIDSLDLQFKNSKMESRFVFAHIFSFIERAKYILVLNLFAAVFGGGLHDYFLLPCCWKFLFVGRFAIMVPCYIFAIISTLIVQPSRVWQIIISVCLFIIAGTFGVESFLVPAVESGLFVGNFMRLQFVLMTSFQMQFHITFLFETALVILYTCLTFYFWFNSSESPSLFSNLGYVFIMYIIMALINRYYEFEWKLQFFINPNNHLGLNEDCDNMESIDEHRGLQK